MCQVNVMDTLSRLSHDTDSEVAMVRSHFGSWFKFYSVAYPLKVALFFSNAAGRGYFLRFDRCRN